MTRYWLAVSLIIMMLIQSIAPALGNCTAMHKPDQQTLKSAINPPTHLAHLTHQNNTQFPQNTAICYATDDCQFHSCSDINFTSSIAINYFTKAQHFLNFSSISPDSTLFAPRFKPPIDSF